MCHCIRSKPVTTIASTIPPPDYVFPPWDSEWVDFNGFLCLFENHIPYICLITHIVTSWIRSFSLVSYHIKTCQPLLGVGRFTNVIPMWSHSKLRFQNTYPLFKSWIKDSEYLLLIAVRTGFEPVSSVKNLTRRAYPFADMMFSRIYFLHQTYTSFNSVCSIPPPDYL